MIALLFALFKGDAMACAILRIVALVFKVRGGMVNDTFDPL